ncbi:MAG TPA: ATP-binding cassette domain-containing protein, partial [Bacteroidia bacterium]|nr:ATP-binding cassette domain-containing protein [Bacteroidia bacterium]
QVKEFSGGMKRRLNIAIGLLHKPQLLILDEPTVGVDVQSRLAIMSYLKKINSEGTTIIYTSHLLKEAEEFCTRIALIDKGKVIAIDTLANLIKQNQCKSLEEVFIKLTGNNYRD